MSKTTTAKQRRHELRCSIVKYCIEPKRMEEVSGKLNITKTSASAYLCKLRVEGVLEYDRLTKTHKRVQGREVLK